jgi:multicomponent Na+:H+ antiporter subunit D
MGAVLLRAGHVLGSNLGGLYRSMPWTTVFCVVGAASISAFPLFSGFVSKSMIMAAMVETGHDWPWLALLFASAGVFHHAGIKIPYFAFFAHDSGLRTPEAPRNMLAAMGLAAAGCLLVGLFPNALYALLPWQTDYVPYTYPHVIVQLQLLLFSALAFAWLQLSGIYPAELRSVNLDADWLYRQAGRRAADVLHAALSAGAEAVRRAARPANRPLALLVGPRGLLAGPMGTGTAALLASLLLAAYLLLYYVGNGG